MFLSFFAWHLVAPQLDPALIGTVGVGIGGNRIAAIARVTTFVAKGGQGAGWNRHGAILPTSISIASWLHLAGERLQGALGARVSVERPECR